MMNKQNGTIEFVKADGKSFKLDDGNWYSVFKSDQLAATKGDYVEFNFVRNGSFNNVKGTVAKGAAPASRPVTGSPKEEEYVNSKGFKVPMFPVPALHPDRSIIRQNSLGHAVNVVTVCGGFAGSEEDEDMADTVISIARKFEAYATGDLDAAAVEEEVKKMLAREHN